MMINHPYEMFSLVCTCIESEEYVARNRDKELISIHTFGTYVVEFLSFSL